MNNEFTDDASRWKIIPHKDDVEAANLLKAFFEAKGANVIIHKRIVDERGEVFNAQIRNHEGESLMVNQHATSIKIANGFHPCSPESAMRDLLYSILGHHVIMLKDDQHGKVQINEVMPSSISQMKIEVAIKCGK